MTRTLFVPVIVFGDADATQQFMVMADDDSVALASGFAPKA
ncbi:MAG: hypothetical protein ACK5NE_07190 [Brachymonas sp.]